LGLFQFLVSMSEGALCAILATSHFKVLAFSCLKVLDSTIVCIIGRCLMAVRFLDVSALIMAASASLMRVASSVILIVVILLITASSIIVLMVMMLLATSTSGLSMEVLL
jgi:hypothetical protein